MFAIESPMLELVQGRNMMQLSAYFAEKPEERAKLARILDEALGDNTQWVVSHPTFALKSIVFIPNASHISIMPRLLPVLKKYGLLTSSEPLIRRNVNNVIKNAAKAGREFILVEMLAGGLSPDHSLGFGDHHRRLIHLAAEYGFLSLLQGLHEMKADLNILDTRGMSALHIACKEKKGKIVEWLVDHNARLDFFDKRGNNVLHYAAEAGQEKLVFNLFNRGIDKYYWNGNGETILHIAALGGHTDLVVRLIEEVGFNPKETSRDGSNALLCACEKEHTDLAIKLVEMGMSVNVANAKKLTPLHFACGTNNEPLALKLLEFGANPNVKDGKKRSPLHLACQEKMESVALKLIDKGVELVEGDRKGCTPLHYACYSGLLQVVEYLLDAEVSINAKTVKGWTPLRYACEGNQIEVVQFLLERGANPLIGDNYDDTVLHHVLEEGKEELASILIPIVPLDLIFAKNAEQQTPVDWVVRSNSESLLVKVESKASGNLNALVAVFSIYAKNNFNKLESRLRYWLERVDKQALITACSGHFDLLKKILECASQEQQIACLEVLPKFKPPAKVTEWTEKLYPELLLETLELEKRCANNPQMEEISESLQKLQVLFVRSCGLARQYLEQWEQTVGSLKAVFLDKEMDEQLKMAFEKYFDPLDLTFKLIRQQMRELKGHLFDKLEKQVQNLKGEKPVPDALLDPIQASVMENPVITLNGSIFDLSTLILCEWKHPYTRESIDPGNVLALEQADVIRIDGKGLNAADLKEVATIEQLKEKLESLGLLESADSTASCSSSQI